MADWHGDTAPTGTFQPLPWTTSPARTSFTPGAERLRGGLPPRALNTSMLNLDPLSTYFRSQAGWPAYYAGRFDEAIKLTQQALAADSNSHAGHLALGSAYLGKRIFDDSIQEIQEAVTLSGRNPWYIAYLCCAYALAGKRDEALKMLEELKEIEKQRYVRPMGFVRAYVALGDYDKAFAYLQTAYEIKDDMIMLKVEPILSPLGSDPRFQALLEKMNFPK